jgi:hypothetical protein
MRFTFRKRIAVAVSAAFLASLVGASGAAAWTGGEPPVKAGPVGGTAMTATVDVTLGLGTSGACSACAPCSPCSRPGLLNLRLGDTLAGLQGRLALTLRQVNGGVQRTLVDTGSKARALQTQVTSLRRQATRLALKLQAQAIAQARATGDSVWLVVDGAGKIVAQSGGMAVSHIGTGAYKLTSESGGLICASLGASADVHLSGPSGPADGGWFLTASDDDNT